MIETKIKWNEGGGYITATYDGSGNGSASIFSDINEGIDREQSIKVETTDKSVSATLMVSQEGLREVFEPSDGLFVLADGGTFNVLKMGGDTPDVPVETYTRLTYIEATGEQYFDLGYVVKETDTIEILYYSTSSASSNKMLCGVSDGSNDIWVSLSSTSGIIRFGSNVSTTVARVYYRYKIVLKKESFVNSTASGTPTFSAMPTLPLYLFARNNNGEADSFAKSLCYYFRITDADGNIVKNLRPVKRSDGIVGMLDEIDGKFYSSQSGVEFVGGLEANIPNGYEVLDCLVFNKDKIYDTGLFINKSCRIDVMFHNGAPVSTAKYIYGVISTGNVASCTAYLASNGKWRFGNIGRSINTGDNDIHVMVQDYNSITKDRTDYKFTTASGDFTTAYTLPVGGIVSASGVYSKGFFGEIYYLQITDENNLLLYWMPVRREDGVEGFWDCVTQSFVEPI